MSLTSPGIDVRRVAGHIGAEITGVRAGPDLSGSVLEVIRSALYEHKVIFFRGQDHLDDESQSGFARRFGYLTRPHPTVPGEAAGPHVLALDAQRGGGVGGASARDQEYHRDVFLSTVYETEHPVVRVHPSTGERALLLGQFVRHILGMPSADSRYLIELFQRHVTRLENTVRWHWTPGDVAIWDNRATQHYAIFDYGTEHRRGERVTVAGPTPVGVDGRPSIALKGNASAYYAGVTEADL